MERYSIRSLPVRTHCGMIDGSAPVVNSLQIGHSRSPKYWSVTGAVGEPRALPLWGMPLSRPAIARVTEVCSVFDLGTPDLEPPLVTIRTTTIATTTTDTKMP